MIHLLSKLSFDSILSTTAGSIVYPPGGKFGPRIQQDIQLVLLYTGEMEVTIGNRILRVQPGHVVILKPGHEEFFTFSRTVETWHRWIAIHVQGLDEHSPTLLNALPEFLPLTEEMNRLTDLILQVQEHNAAESDLLRHLGMAALHLYPAECTRSQSRQEKHPALYAAQSWIREHYMEHVDLAAIARHAGVSPEHVVRLFKRHLESTPMQYVWSYRVNKAAELLAHTGLTVTEIAYRCGFKTSHHLARQMKKFKGRTASEIRQNSWEGIR
ncbi:hypothetical protein JCM10914A_42980 [Paenibacillus sp. JCM 10914]|uniref:helix-turn-helix domain-containing protein n=1 Tax=Paenibacillus sp. JCM 10914 TaxID=1236974 RepID=UPI0003CC2D14|nr:AraC family transcriptional regulator [Paenibacillus sp. JCM 10914]GAE05516.1 transcriptional regulator, AraC family [Paenibacillus sp. JCM 10914]